MRKIFSLFAALTLSAGLWAETVECLEPEYIDGDVTKGIEYWYVKVTDATPITSSSSTWGDGGRTWLVVNSDVTISQRVTCDGEVHLILADGAKLTAEQGITVSGESNSLTIYAQTADIAQMGQLIADATSVESAAGIGGGGYEENGSNITINGGIITTAGGYKASGIGGGEDGPGSDITINGGIVAATGGEGAAGIGGGGNGGSGSNITINGGIVEATGGYGAAGIGGGMVEEGSNITINGGEVTATGGEGATGIGGGDMGSGSNIFVATTCVVKAGNTPAATTVITNTGADLASSLAGKQYVTIEPKPLPVSTTYLDENGETKNIDAWEVKDASEAVTWGTAGQTTWFVVNGTNVQLSKGAICAGDVRLILADNAKLTATGGINVTGTNSLTIYAQSTGTQMGQLSANSGSMIAGIGGGDSQPGNNITINGGTVEATGGSGAAGIGGGRFASGSNITINGGTVEATGGSAAAGIGGGNGGTGSNITINGGTITANNGSLAAGIGGGNNGAGSNIIINGGTITANGGNLAVGIGGGRFASGSNIYISDAYILKAGATANPTDVIAHSSATDMAGTLTQQYVKIEGLATPYTRTTSVDQWATVCLPYAATSFEGATFYKLNYFDQVDKLYIEEVETLEAGMPYIFQATADVVVIEHADATLTYGDEQTEYGLHGSFARTILESDGNLAALSSGTVMIAELEAKVTVPACRAYFDMSEVPTMEQPHSAPLRCIGVPSQTPTGLGQWNKDKGQKTYKVIENGQFVIIKDNKMYNAQGIEL